MTEENLTIALENLENIVVPIDVGIYGMESWSRYMMQELVYSTPTTICPAVLCRRSGERGDINIGESVNN